jgi:hypothetical protein
MAVASRISAWRRIGNNFPKCDIFDHIVGCPGCRNHQVAATDYARCGAPRKAFSGTGKADRPIFVGRAEILGTHNAAQAQAREGKGSPSPHQFRIVAR